MLTVCKEKREEEEGAQLGTRACSPPKTLLPIAAQGLCGRWPRVEVTEGGESGKRRVWVLQSKASLGSARLTRGAMGRGRHWDLEADCGRKIRAGQECRAGSHAKTSFQNVGEGSTGRRASLSDKTPLSTHLSRPLGSGPERARPEVRASLPRKRRKEAEPPSRRSETGWRPLRLGVGSQRLVPRGPVQGCGASGVPLGPTKSWLGLGEEVYFSRACIRDLLVS